MATYTPFSDKAVLVEFGKRIASSRLNCNWTQADLANKAGVSKSTVEHIEKGQSTQLLNMVKILRALGLLNQFLGAFPEQGPSPMELLAASRKQAASKRKRASKPRATNKAETVTYPAASSGTPTANIAAEPKAAWVWGEDK
ncbi:helix-turn-helix domain-containing protein [Fibrobacter sp.]|uniref:helix-turn-helix domain-containing protein n=1 Tax=Fibrobacter sp. TaxID=35828 RepID=UPI00388FEF8B